MSTPPSSENQPQKIVIKPGTLYQDPNNADHWSETPFIKPVAPPEAAQTKMPERPQRTANAGHGLYNSCEDMDAYADALEAQLLEREGTISTLHEELENSGNRFNRLCERTKEGFAVKNAEVERLTRERDEARKVAEEQTSAFNELWHHNIRLGVIAIARGEGEKFEWRNERAESAESSLAALRAEVDAVEMPEHWDELADGAEESLAGNTAHDMRIDPIRVQRHINDYRASLAGRAEDKKKLQTLREAVIEHISDGHHAGPRSQRLRAALDASGGQG